MVDHTRASNITQYNCRTIAISTAEISMLQLPEIDRTCLIFFSGSQLFLLSKLPNPSTHQECQRGDVAASIVIDARIFRSVWRLLELSICQLLGSLSFSFHLCGIHRFLEVTIFTVHCLIFLQGRICLYPASYVKKGDKEFFIQVRVT